MAREIIKGGIKMAGKFFKPINKMMGAIGLIEEDEDENDVIEDDDENEDDDTDYEEPEIVNSRKNNVVSIKTNSAPKVILKKPREIQDVLEVVDAVKSKRIVIMNIVEAEPRLAQRMIDYVVGGCYALNGSFQEIGKSIYLVAPENVEISNELKQALNKKTFYSFDNEE